MIDLPRLTREALALPFEARLELAHALWASIHSEHADDSQDDLAAILEIAAEREAEIERGDVVAIPRSEAMAQVRAALQASR